MEEIFKTSTTFSFIPFVKIPYLMIVKKKKKIFNAHWKWSIFECTEIKEFPPHLSLELLENNNAQS